MNIYKPLYDCILSLNNSNKLWRINDYRINNTFYEKKINAGADSSLRRNILRVNKEKPWKFIKTNIDILHLGFENEDLYFFPDRIFIIKNKEIGQIDYKNISLNIQETQFIEDESVPNDSEVIGYTWRYVNKNGTPDRRFNNNYQIPICIYYSIEIKSKEGLEAQLHCSNKLVATNFVKQFNKIIKKS